MSGARPSRDRQGAVVLAALLACALIGCGRAPAPPAGTGARAAAEAYFDALRRKDWPAAYARLHPDSQARWSLARFTQLAEQTRANVGFEPERVQMWSCDESGSEAVAHVVWLGGGRYEDAAALRQDGDRWGVVLPQNFGHRRKR